ncbi:MAG: hypothetical protein ACOC85_00610 [Thermoplasmatota archaeon]
MAVKDIRKRYIAFRLKNGETDRKRMINAIREAFTKNEYRVIEPWLTVFTGKKGIIRVSHLGKKRAIEVLNRTVVNDCKVETITTSGTIKNAKERLFKDE